jgi:hypothetical protein
VHAAIKAAAALNTTLPELPVPGDVICDATPEGTWLTVSVTWFVSPMVRWIVTVTAGEAPLSGAVAEADERVIVIGCGIGEELPPPPQPASQVRSSEATPRGTQRFDTERVVSRAIRFIASLLVRLGPTARIESSS